MAEIDDNSEKINNSSSEAQAIKTTEFMKETIKQRPINRKILVRRLLATVAMAVLFGLIACLTFLVLEPVIDRSVNSDNTLEIEAVTFPEETVEEETRPEDMIVEETELHPVEIDQAPLGDEQIEQVLNEMELGVEDYLSLSSVVTDMAEEVSKSMVSVVAITKDTDWFSNEYADENVVSGLIVADNGRDLLVLTDLGAFTNMDSLEVVLNDGTKQKADLLMKDKVTGLSVVAVNKIGMKRATVENTAIIQMGSSANKNLNGTPIVAMGRPLGIESSIGIGYITSCSSLINMADANYKLLTTDIYGSPEGSGFLFNVKGQLMGVIDMSNAPSGMDNMISGMGISELKRMIERLSNGNEISYLGIYGTDVTKDINESMGVPIGVYITRLDIDSPLLEAGIQSGDIITRYAGIAVTTFQDMNNLRLTMDPESQVKIEIKRQSPDGYTAMEYDIVLGHQP